MAALPQGFQNSLLPGATQTLGSAISSSFNGAVGLTNASSRQNVAQMFGYSDAPAGPAPILSFPNASTDWRVRISLAPNSNYFYNDSSNYLLSPLINETGGQSTNSIAGAINTVFGLNTNPGTTRVGVVFPYTPQLSITHTANYSSQKLTHNNYTQYFYDNSEVQSIGITGDFTVQNVNEGQYLLATIYFFRSLTKMFFGADQLAGNPPPLVYLNGYGQYYLPNVPCLVTSFSHTMPQDVDYMDIPEPSITSTNYNPQSANYRLNSTRLPTTSQITLSLQPVYSRMSQSQGFSLSDFSAGALINPVGAAVPASAFGATQGAQNISKSFNRGNGGFL
jgi:hypothetical protein